MPTDYFESLFVKPMQITGIWRLLMLLPLSLSIGIVYKTMRCERLGTIPSASVMVAVKIVGGMMLIGVVPLVVFRLLA